MKRTVSLLLAVVLILSLAVGALAADATAASRFTDWEDIDHQPEVAMLTDLGLLSGYADGSFRPYNCITRAEIAKIISSLLTEQVPEAKTDRFTDTGSNWARNYIEYCADKGILAGANGTFRPNDYVTVRELAKMLLTALGHDATPYTGADWAKNVDADAEKLGIYSGLEGDRSLFITREDACLIISNALQCPVITGYDTSDKPQYVLDSMMSPMSLLEYRFQVIPVTGVVQANAVADLRDGTPLEGNLIHIQGYTRDFLVTAEVAQSAALLGRTVTVYARFYNNYNQVFGMPSLREGESVATLNSAGELRAIVSYGALKLTETTGYYKNLQRDDASCLDTMVPGDTVTIIDHEADGVIDLVFVTTAQPEEPAEEPEA